MPIIVHKTAIVDSRAELDDGVEIGPCAIIESDVKLSKGVRVGAHAIIERFTAIGEGSRVFPHAVIGGIPQDLKFDGSDTSLEIGGNTVIREFVTVNRGTGGGGGITGIGDNCLLMAYSHVAHDCRLADNVVMANAATLAGHVQIEKHAIVGGLSAIHQFVRVGKHSIIGGCSGVPKDVLPFSMVNGQRARAFGLNKIGLARHNFPQETTDNLQKAYRILFRSKLNTSDALERISREITGCPGVDYLVGFINSSKRGIIKE
ncbi:MAG: acyl-ACP--UDP-N-acetylglucosamine O-acyltransferase [bacterium]